MPLNEQHQHLIEQMMEPLLQEQFGTAKTRQELTAGIAYFLQVMNDPDNRTTEFAAQFQEPREIAGITAFGSFAKGEAREFMIEALDGTVKDLMDFMPDKVQADPRLLGWQKDLVLADVRGRRDHEIVEEALTNGHKDLIKANIDYLFDHLTPESIEASKLTDKRLTIDSLKQDVAQVTAAMQAHANNDYEPFSRIFVEPEKMLRIDQYGQLTRGAVRQHMIEFVDQIVRDAATALRIDSSESGWNKAAAITHMESRADHHTQVVTVPQQELVADWFDYLRSLQTIVHPADDVRPAEPVIVVPHAVLPNIDILPEPPARVGQDQALLAASANAMLMNHAASQRRQAQVPVSSAAARYGEGIMRRSSPPTPVRDAEGDEGMDGFLESHGAPPRSARPLLEQQSTPPPSRQSSEMDAPQSAAPVGNNNGSSMQMPQSARQFGEQYQRSLAEARARNTAASSDNLRPSPSFAERLDALRGVYGPNNTTGRE